ncbi:MAG: HAD family hydrolase [Deltaproteobacteria bacterium]|nr:HAD family hydrolase [Deltaproteobacteria bacterium]
MPPSARPRLVLFDIDGTLVMSGRIGSRAVKRAFHEVFGVEDATTGVLFDGKTDPGILRELLELHGLGHRHCDDTRAAFFQRYLEVLADERACAETGHVHPGIHELLAALEACEDVTVGLLTGNIREGARIKLERFSLWARFPFGAFGDDAETRDELVPIALTRAHDFRRIRFAPADTYVIGDSLRDIQCARAGGAVAVAVATGGTPIAELAARRPDALFPDLSDTARVLEALGVG